MAVKSKVGAKVVQHQPGPPKRSRQGRSLHTHLGATSRNSRKKRYRGQGS